MKTTLAILLATFALAGLVILVGPVALVAFTAAGIVGYTSQQGS